MIKSWLIALQFLTRLPLPKHILRDNDYTPQRLGGSVLWYPIVGLLIGVLLASIPWCVQHVMDKQLPLLQAGLVLSAWVLITGALHLDGLADSADAWVGGYGDRQKTLAIMLDPYTGPVGVSVLVTVLIIRFAALSTVVTQPLLWLVLVPFLARAAIIALFLTTPYVRKQGIAAEHATHLPRMVAWGMLLFSVGVCYVVFNNHTLWLILVTAVMFVLLRRLMLQRLGGMTGDTAGAMIELTETALLVTLALL
ncbi:MAG: adenosylcobinamide-GDP ribazoletransferase [Gammaproteobacteria bacterium]|nr:adenosylcobinamide-GDP ribazoletransferase [Gammaproteobacteria bacterium]MDH5651128.1 adenosylcobinamide-GDP ribazoletransferase [Gammaproteobacteria bacterium]